MYKHGSIMLAVASFFFLSFLTFVLLFPSQKAVAEGFAPARSAGDNMRPLEVHIANNGLVLLRSARVSSVSADRMTVTTSWGSSAFTWTLKTNGSSYGDRRFGTRFLDRQGADILSDRIQVGDLVTVTGVLDAGASGAVIITDSVRDLVL